MCLPMVRHPHAAASSRFGPRIWLVAADWRTRARPRSSARRRLRRDNDGGLGDAGRDAVRGGDGAHLLVAELTGDESPAVLALLHSFPAPRLVLRAARAPATGTFRAAGIDAVLSRPFTVGDVVNATR